MNTFVLISLYYHKKRDWCRCTTPSPHGASLQLAADLLVDVPIVVAG